MADRTRVTGVPEVSAAFALMMATTTEATGDTVSKVLHQVKRHERTQLSRGWHPPGTPTGSIPPNPPWRVSGDLSRSVEVEEPHLAGWLWTGRMGPTAVYARIQELGGFVRIANLGSVGPQRRSSYAYLPPRPHLRPAWDIVRPTVRHTFYDAWTRSTRPAS